ncbi:hypothetical protein BJ165DRAFT_1527513 [Panaeolus papilionaceus]|nr:hypothetical protein BJ165DRAFT_1527513 [Panaeolus papilionaceus]
MSVKDAPSLPSFKQAFSNQSLQIVNHNNSLPPIMQHQQRKKRPAVEHDIRVKQENDEENSNSESHNNSDDDHLPPSALMPLKKRRVTVSGTPPHPLSIDVRPHHDQTASTPISPVVMGFTVQRDNPKEMEQVRSMLTVKQKQKALIEQRRGSAAGISVQTPVIESNTIPQSTSPTTNHSQLQQQQQQPAQQQTGPATRTSRRSPNNISATTPPTTNTSNNSRRQSQPQQQQQSQRATSPPPPPPSSSNSHPRNNQHIHFHPLRSVSLDAVQLRWPVIQSAPPVQTSFYQQQYSHSGYLPDRGGGGGGPGGGLAAGGGRLSMALPRLPTLVGAPERRVASNVPPTPTRMSAMAATQSQPAHPSMLSHVSTPGVNATAASGSAVPNRSPPASIPIASTLVSSSAHAATPIAPTGPMGIVPPTPTSLHRPGYAGDKAAFLAPFEMFYDALNDSKQLKKWLGEQLSKSQGMVRELGAMQEKMAATSASSSSGPSMNGFNEKSIIDTVERAVESRVAPMSREMGMLRRRVEELEDLLRSRERERERDMYRERLHPAHGASDGFAFPSSSSGPSGARPELSRRLSSPGWGSSGSTGRSPHTQYRDVPPPPPLSRQNSSSGGVPMVVVSGERDRHLERLSERERERERDREREREHHDREREREKEQWEREWREREERERERERERKADRERDIRDREESHTPRQQAGGSPPTRRDSVAMASPDREDR